MGDLPRARLMKTLEARSDPRWGRSGPHMGQRPEALTQRVANPVAQVFLNHMNWLFEATPKRTPLDGGSEASGIRA